MCQLPVAEHSSTLRVPQMAHIVLKFLNGLSTLSTRATATPRCLLGCLRQVAGCSEKLAKCPDETYRPATIDTGLADSLFPQERYSAFACVRSPHTTHQERHTPANRQTPLAGKSCSRLANSFRIWRPGLLTRVNIWRQIQVCGIQPAQRLRQSTRSGARQHSSESNSWPK